MGVRRLFGIETTFGNPNSVASSTVLSLPFLQYLWWRRHEVSKTWPLLFRRYFPVFLIAYFVLAVTAIILTNSRSGAVGFTTFLVLFGSTEPKPRKKLRRILISIMTLSVVWVLLPEPTRNRITTLWNSEAGPASAKSSAEGRRESFLAGVEMFSQRPITGVGIGNTAIYRRAFVDGVYLAPHNFYGEVLGETGIVGAGAFILLLASLSANVLATTRLSKEFTDPTVEALANLSRSCGYVVVLLLLSGLGGDGMLRFQWLWLGAFALLARSFSESIFRAEFDSPNLESSE
jgi:O-antigen ligase